MSPRLRLARATVGALILGLIPGPVAAHALGGTFQLPIPLWLYLVGAGAAVAAAFAIVALAPRAERDGGGRPRRMIPARVAGTSSWMLRVLGLLWWYGAIAVGVLIGDISPLPAVLFWVGIWIGLPIVAALIGNSWAVMSPFRTTFAGLERLAGRSESELDAGVGYPARLARWPAVALLGGAIWAELILPGGEQAFTVALLMASYTLLTLLGMLVVGREAWLRNAELFDVLLAWYGRIGPLAGRRVRAWFSGLTDLDGLGMSDAAFVVLLLAGVTYDGLSETRLGYTFLVTLLPPIQSAFGATLTTFLLVHTLTFFAVFATFAAGFGIVVALTRILMRRGARGGRPADIGSLAGALGATLMPIAAGYVLAHYLTLVIQALIWLPSLVTNPLTSLAPPVDWIPVGFVWYFSVAAIVGGHVAGVTLAHRLTSSLTPSGALRAGLPMVLLMIGYTVLSLWIIAQPIVVEPGVVPLEAAVPALSRLGP